MYGSRGGSQKSTEDADAGPKMSNSTFQLKTRQMLAAARLPSASAFASGRACSEGTGP